MGSNLPLPPHQNLLPPEHGSRLKFICKSIAEFLLPKIRWTRNNIPEIAHDVLRSPLFNSVLALILFALAYAKAVTATVAVAIALAWGISIFGIARYQRISGLGPLKRLAVTVALGSILFFSAFRFGSWVIKQTPSTPGPTFAPPSEARNTSSPPSMILPPAEVPPRISRSTRMAIKPFAFTEGLSDTLTVLIKNGTTHIEANFERANLEKQKQNGLLSIAGERPLTVYVQDGVFYVDALITDAAGHRAITITRNVLEVKPADWDVNYNASALEIVDVRQRPLFQMIRRRSNLIQINGLFASKSGSVLDFRAAKPIFEYPAWKYRGVYAEPDEVKTQDLSGLSLEELKSRTSQYVNRLQAMYAEFDKDDHALHANLGLPILGPNGVNLTHMERHAVQDREYGRKFAPLLPEGRSLEKELMARLNDKPGFISPDEPSELKSGILNGPDSLTMLAQYFQNLVRQLN